MSVLHIPKLEWSDPIRLSSYLLCPKDTGIYAIGEPREASVPITLAVDFDAYMGRWPGNFRGLYVGISLSGGEGIRARLRAHARDRGCKRLRPYLAAVKDLHFLYIVGLGATNFEAALVHIKQSEIFPLNRRPELKRQAKRISDAMDAEAQAAGFQLADFSSMPDYFEDG